MSALDRAVTVGDYLTGTALLAFIAAHGAQNRLEIFAAFPGCKQDTVRRLINRLRDEKQLQPVKVLGELSSYELTDKALRSLVAAQGGTIATPREIVTTGNYDGADLKRRVHRAGAYRAFELPSRGLG